MGDPEHLDINRLLAVLKHPLRREILKQTIDVDPISPRELSDKIECSLSTVAYHVRVLAQSGALDLVDTKQVRGSTQHFYRVTLKPERAREVLGLAERPDSGHTGEEIS